MKPGADPAFRTGHQYLELNVLTARVGQEIEALARMSSEVQLALSRCHFAAHTDPRAIRGLQRIDQITQALDDLGRVMLALSMEVPENLGLRAAPILACLRLHDLLLRLDPATACAAREPLPDTGEIQWL